MLTLNVTVLCLMSCCIFNCLCTSLDDDQHRLMEQSLSLLCPKVDICDKNASSSELLPNGHLDGTNSVSCCRGCSCHPECRKTMNCCRREDTETINNQTNDPVCTYMRVGSQEKDLNADTPAYYTILSEPVGGCVDNQPFQANTGNTLFPTCGTQPVAQWGDLLPVLSKTTKKIYKNELCARCHGDYDVDLFTPYLVCKIDKEGGEMAEFFQKFEINKLSPYCTIDFDHALNKEVLLSNRCLVTITTTCMWDTTLPIKDIQMSIDEIKNACENGFYAPLVQRTIGYKNVFCAHCNTVALNSRNLVCDGDNLPKNPDETKFTFLLDTSLLESKATPTSGGQAVTPYPVVCLKENASWKETSCRKLFCPFGKLRDKNGVCVFVSKTWITSGISITVNLTPTEGNLSEIIDNTLPLVNDIIENRPWPNQWLLRSVHMKVKDGFPISNGVFTITLLNTDGEYDTNTFLISIEETMSKLWYAEANGSRFQFEQSFLECAVLYSPKEGKTMPKWQDYLKDNVIENNNTHKESSTWVKMYSSSSTRRIRFITPIDKMVFCDQVELMAHEFDIEVDNYIIKPKLTENLLFDKEFVLLRDKVGNRVARVCLYDTPFALRVPNGCSRSPIAVLEWFDLSLCLLLLYYVK